MTYKKILIVFLLIFIIFGFSTVFGADISTTNVSSDLSYYVKEDKKMLLDAFHKNNIFTYEDFTNYVKNLGLYYSDFAWFYCIYPLGSNVSDTSPYSIVPDFSYVRNIYFFNSSNLPIMNSGSGNWYNIPTDYKLVYCSGSLSVRVNTGSLTFSTSNLPSQVPVPNCWQWFSVSSLFADDFSSSINNVNDTLTEDSSSQADINLSTHNDEMNNASDSIKNSNLYSKFSNLSNELDEAFTYDNDDVSTLPVSFKNTNVVLKSNEISKFFKNNNLGFVITLWQSILWFSVLYTMFLFIRKIYKAVAGGNPVDDVQKSLSNEDDKMIGGF